MKIKIAAVDRLPSQVIIDFKCLSGRGRAKLVSSQTDLKVNDSVSVELDIDTRIDLGKTCIIVASESPFIEISEGGKVHLGLNIEAKDEDGMLYCRLSSDCLVMLESVPNASLSEGVSIQMEVEPSLLELSVI